MSIPFDNSYARLPERFFARQQPAQVPAPALIRLNTRLAAQLSLDAGWLASAEGVAMLAGNAMPPGADPIAQAYAGHQFGGFVPQLGDGRAILLGEVVGTDGLRRDVQLKGSGRTPFSRGGDGKAALGPVLREYIVSEAMSALGVPSTRALAAVSTGERIRRQEGVVPGGVFTRVAASHIRVGTFQYFFARKDVDALKVLADYALARHYPHLLTEPAPYTALLAAVMNAQADLIAQWMSLGFIHGVMNTDNTAISGETIDYGPCAFMDAFDRGAVFSSIDSGGRYAWDNQPDIGLWNVTRFAETLPPLLADNREAAIATAEGVLTAYPARVRGQFAARFLAKLGLPSDAPEGLVHECLDLLGGQKVDFTVFFTHLTRVARGADARDLAGLFPDQEAFNVWFDRWRAATEGAPRLEAMLAANPVRIPRNHRVEEAIQHAYSGDFGPFHRLVDALAAPYDERPEYADLEAPPLPDEVVHETFCGT